jgi:hypothetical protein
VTHYTSSIGPGTSAAANEVANTAFTFAQGSTPSWITLFSGLDLGPGTYYLMLNENDFGAPGGVWFGNASNTVELGTGLSQSADYTSFPRVVPGDPIYPPSAPVTPFSLGLEYKVETVPEPSLGRFVAGAMLGFFAVNARGGTPAAMTTLA